MNNTCCGSLDPLIQETLDEYKDKIDAKKPDSLSISKYKVEKPWGWEIWAECNKYYVYKVIHMNKGCRCSLQSHNYKYETNYIIEGKAEVLLEDENGILQSKTYGVGEGWSVPIGKKHRVIAVTDYTALEVSTPHLNDVIRYADDSNRISGKIDSEHNK